MYDDFQFGLVEGPDVVLRSTPGGFEMTLVAPILDAYGASADDVFKGCKAVFLDVGALEVEAVHDEVGAIFLRDFGGLLLKGDCRRMIQLNYPYCQIQRRFVGSYSTCSGRFSS